MLTRRAAVATAGTFALACGVLTTLGTTTASAAEHGAARAHYASPLGGSNSLAGWGSAANKTISNQITADQKGLAAQGIELTQWGPDPASGKTKIYLTHYSEAARRALEARYGTDIVVARRSMPRPSPFGRNNDSAPFFGGDFITVPGGGCTGGPIVEGNASGRPFMLTAGHCAAVNATVKTHGVTMGTVTNRRLCNNCIDAETVGGTYAAQIWGGGSTNNPLYYEDGALFARPGSLVTNDSAYSGEIRTITVEAVNQSVTFDDGLTRRYLTTADKSGAAVCQPGDSGGPWIQHEANGDRVKVVGTTVGGTGTAGDLTTCYYEQINDIDNWFNTFVP